MKPDVWMICMTDHPLSMYYRGRIEESWTSRGFKLNIFEAVTPQTLQQHSGLTFGMPESDKEGIGSPRRLTKVEQSIWYSHYGLWKLASAKASPIIIIEHDAYLDQDLPTDLFLNKNIVCFGNVNGRTYPATSYYLTRTGAKKLIGFRMNQLISYPVDAAIYHVVKKNDNCEFQSSYAHQLQNLGRTNDDSRET